MILGFFVGLFIGIVVGIVVAPPYYARKGRLGK